MLDSLNLELSGVRELSLQERCDTEGGNFFLHWAAAHALDYAGRALWNGLVRAHGEKAVGDPMNWKIMDR
jgi:hypothetical protein